MYLFLLILLCLGTAGCVEAQSSGGLKHYDLAGDPVTRVELPAQLAEISGLAFTADGRLLAHGDEQAVIYQVDPATGRLAKRFSIGTRVRPLLGDFEDIQVVGERLFLLTSDGVVVEAGEGADGTTVAPVGHSKGLRGACEAEGMTWAPGSKSLLILCKRTKGKRWEGQVVFLALSPDSREYEPEPRLTIPMKDLERVTGEKRFEGSALTRHPRTGNYLLLAAPQHVFAEIDSTGKVVAGGRLSSRNHRQPEGIAVGPDQTLYISDEAAGKTATITGYGYRR